MGDAASVERVNILVDIVISVVLNRLNSDLENNVTDVIHDLQKNEKIGLSTGVNWRKINETDELNSD